MFRVITLVGEDWIHWRLGLARIRILFEIAYVCWWDGMRHSCECTVQDILVSNDRGDANSKFVIRLPMLIFRT